jgi:hypothetical protein
MKNRKNRSCIHPVACGGRKKWLGQHIHQSIYQTMIILIKNHNCIIGKRGKNRTTIAPFPNQ